MADSFGDVVERLRRSTVQVKAQRNGTGSGVIWSPDGRIVTNAHVVEGARNLAGVEVELWDGRRLPGRIVKRDRRRDLAALHVESNNLPAVIPGDSTALRPGEFVIAVGNPLGFTGAASTGVVHRSGIESRSWVVSQLRLAPGNSGGPLANAHGHVVGINTMISGGLAFAISSNSVVEFLRPSQQTPAGLGVLVQPVLMKAGSRQLGLIVLEVIPDSPAEHASLLQGDILTAAGGREFQSVHDLAMAIEANRGGVLEVQFRRGGNEKIRSVAARMISKGVRAA